MPGSAASADARSRDRLEMTELHSSVSEPVLDTMNFLNEVTHRYPDAISFAPGALSTDPSTPSR